MSCCQVARPCSNEHDEGTDCVDSIHDEVQNGCSHGSESTRYGPSNFQLVWTSKGGFGESGSSIVHKIFLCPRVAGPHFSPTFFFEIDPVSQVRWLFFFCLCFHCLTLPCLSVYSMSCVISKKKHEPEDSTGFRRFGGGVHCLRGLHEKCHVCARGGRRAVCGSHRDD